MAWASNTGRKIDTFTAIEKNNELVMQGIYLGLDTKIIFYDISNQHFSWRMEREDKKTHQWKAVYKIEATKRLVN